MNSSTLKSMNESSWLIQRLQKPRRLPPDHAFAKLDNVFSFGGGRKNGGLSDQAMDLLRDVWSFDYMGAAEFEWGAVPEALSAMAKSELDCWTIIVPLAEVPKNWRDKTKKPPAGEATIYVLGPAAWRKEIDERINGWAREEYAKLKEPLHLTTSLRPVEEWDTRTCGWLELDNGFLFFTDLEMWSGACRLFGVETEGEWNAA